MTGIAIKDFKQKKVYDKLISNKIVKYLTEMFFLPLFKVININIKANNDSNVILDALKSGNIFYSDGVFKAKNKFSNRLSLEFEKLGAKYNKQLKGYQFKEVPDWLNNALFELQNLQQMQFNQLNDLLSDFENNLDHYIKTMIFDDEVIKILVDSKGQIHENVKQLNIIEPEFSEQQMQEIAKDYTNNMQLYIKKWTKKHIIEMRQQVKELVLAGYREKDVQQILKTQYGMSKRKAKFLAQNETSIMLAQVKKQYYTEMGFEYFKWNTIMDGRERQEHADLNKKIFRFDNPPIIDTRTGQRGLPGETYNCRCSLTPYRRDGFV